MDQLYTVNITITRYNNLHIENESCPSLTHIQHCSDYMNVCIHGVSTVIVIYLYYNIPV
jgi:hypothetical protein